MLARMICVVSRHGIIVAMYSVVLVASVQLAYVLPQPWSAGAVIALAGIGGVAISGKWPERKARLETLGLGYQANRSAETASTVTHLARQGPRERFRSRLEMTFQKLIDVRHRALGALASLTVAAPRRTSASS